MMGGTGFVAVVNRSQGPLDDLAVSHSAGGGVAVWQNGRSFFRARPLASTPEAEIELQPVLTPTAVLAYAGRVDNRADIARAIGYPDLVGAPDGTVIATAYEAYGPTFPTKVSGEYSFIVVNRRDGSVVAGRDALGVCKLYYYDDDGALYVASALGLLLDSLQSRRPLDPDAILEYLAEGGRLPYERTMYAGVRQLRPAHILQWNGGELVARRYWQPDPRARVVLRSEAEYDERLLALLKDAVRSALRSSGPVCSDISGGLDSSTVTSIAARLKTSFEGGTQELIGYSRIASRTSTSDERSYQLDVLKAYPIRHIWNDMDGDGQFLNGVDASNVIPSTGMFSTTAASAQEELFRANGIRVHLNGFGGDQVFCGDKWIPLYLSEQLRHMEWREWARHVRGWLNTGEHSLWRLLWDCSLAAAPRAIEHDGPSQVCLMPWWTSEFRAQLKEYSVHAHERRSGERLFSSAATEHQYRRIVAMQPGTSPRIRAVDVRYPLLYRPLVEFVLAIPWGQKLQPGLDRVIQRRALRGIVPDRILTRTDKGNHTPVIARGIREQWRDLRPFVSGRELAARGVVEPARFLEACERLRHGRTRTLTFAEGPLLLATLALEAWLSHRGERAGCGRPMASALTQRNTHLPARPRDCRSADARATGESELGV